MSWLSLVVFQALHHVPFRDEVRALSIAIAGPNVFDMLNVLHGEGHPAVWYLILRSAHFLIHKPEVLQISSILVSGIAVLFLIMRSPFSILLTSLLLLSHFILFAYSVMARNYGISMLLIFLFVTIYEKNRDKGYLLGVVLLLLANCNAHSVILVWSILVFWLIDIVTDNDLEKSKILRVFLINASIAILGITFCLITIYPTYNDAAALEKTDGFSLLFLKAIFSPSEQFSNLMMVKYISSAIQNSFIGSIGIWYVKPITSVILYGSTLGLVKRPGAFLASLISLLGLSLFFSFIYPGGYRHQALWLVLLISMYWLLPLKRNDSKNSDLKNHKNIIAITSNFGKAMFFSILLLQLPGGIYDIVKVFNEPPQSRSRDLGVLLNKKPYLKDAIIIADPDFLIEALPYYISNRTYLMHEQRYGNVVHFTKNAILELSLNDILTNARNLRLSTGKPVLILMEQRLNQFISEQRIHEGYNWYLITPPEQITTFLNSTQLIESFSPSSSDESYDVYLLK